MSQTGPAPAVPSMFGAAALLQRRDRASRRVRDGGLPADFLLRRVADDFADRLGIVRRTFAIAVDLGCHCGLLGRMLRETRGIADVTSVDPSAAMLALAGPPGVRAELDHLPFAASSVDLVVSGLALQSIDDLPGALAQIRAILRPDGLFLGAVVGGASLGELRRAFLEAETDVTGGASPRVAPMIDVRDFGSLLQRAGFALPVVDSDTVTVTYADPLALMHDLRAMGATNVLAERARTFLRRDVLARAVEVYRQRFANADGRIRATFEILTATAWAPHENQPKPLQPGSAKVNLADVLKARRP